MTTQIEKLFESYCKHVGLSKGRNHPLSDYITFFENISKSQYGANIWNELTKQYHPNKYDLKLIGEVTPEETIFPWLFQGLRKAEAVSQLVSNRECLKRQISQSEDVFSSLNRIISAEPSSDPLIHSPSLEWDGENILSNIGVESKCLTETTIENLLENLKLSYENKLNNLKGNLNLANIASPQSKDEANLIAYGCTLGEYFLNTVGALCMALRPRL